MDWKRVVARNVVWNWAALGVSMATGFVLAPFLVSRLGASGYGLWIVIGALTSYFGMLDLGVRGSVGRAIAFHRAQGDVAAANAVLSTALALLGGAALLAVGATGAAWIVFPNVFTVTPEELPGARLALLLVGLNLGVAFVGDLFDGVLWAAQRQDILGAIEIVTVVARSGATFVLIGSGGGLVTLAVLTLAFTGVGGLLKTAAACRLQPDLRLNLAVVRRDVTRSLFEYGIWYFLLSAARTVTAQIGPVVIGMWLSVQQVTPFSVAARLVAYASSVVIAATGVLTPVATALQAREEPGDLRHLFLGAARYCLALTLLFVSLLLFLGGPLVRLWMGPALEPAVPLLLILVAGETLPMAQLAGHMILLGIGSPRVLAGLNLLNTVVLVLLGLALAVPWGLNGVCLALAAAGTLCRGLLQLVYTCRVVGTSVGQYAQEVFVPVAACAALPITGLAVLATWSAVTTWPGLVLYAATFTVCYAVSCSPLLGRARLAALWANRPGFFRPAASQGVEG